VGSHFGSIHVRSVDQGAIVAVLEDLVRNTSMQFLVAPPRNAWVWIYPSMYGQDTSESAALAAALADPVLHLIVHDSDVFAYEFRRGGELLDEYSSKPDYFEPASDERWQATAGKPQVLAAIVGAEIAPRIASVLKRSSEGSLFDAEARIKQLADLLGIANADTSYEYLLENEGGIKRLKGWTSVPDARALARKRQAEERAQWKELRRTGRVLLEPRARIRVDVREVHDADAAMADGKPRRRDARPRELGPSRLDEAPVGHARETQCRERQHQALVPAQRLAVAPHREPHEQRDRAPEHDAHEDDEQQDADPVAGRHHVRAPSVMASRSLAYVGSRP